MWKKIFTLVLTVLLLNMLCVTPVAAGSRKTKEEKQVAKIRSMVARLGTGPKAGIEIKLRDKSELKGYVSERADDHFVITDEKTGSVTSVTYAQVDKIKLLPFVKTAFQRDVSTGRIFKNAAIGFGLLLTGVMVVCLISKRCTE